jgi:hypothetical protein
MHNAKANLNIAYATRLVILSALSSFVMFLIPVIPGTNSSNLALLLPELRMALAYGHLS